jgi:hypothetical protein
MQPDERWLSYPAREMARFAISSWRERFDLVVEDLAQLPAKQGVVAEGVGFFPEIIAPHLPDPSQGVWLIPSEAFKRESVVRREKLSTVKVSDRARAVESLIARDLLINDHIRREAVARGLTLHEIDGSRGLDEMTAIVERQFERWL